MPTDVNAVAEPSAAPVQYDSWDDKGNPIVSAKAEPTPSKQDSAPAASEEEKPVTAAESGAAKAQESKAEGKGKLTAEERIRQLNAEKNSEKDRADALEARIRALESHPKETSKAEPVKAEAKAAPKLPERPKRPNMADFDGSAGKTLAEYETAMDKYTDDLSAFHAAKAVSEERQRQAEAVQTEKVNSQLTEARKQYSDFDTVAAPIVKQFQENAEIHVAVRAALGNSPILPHLMYALGGDQTRLTQLVNLSKSDPIEAIKRLGAIEAIVMEELNKASKKEEPKAEVKADDKKTPEDPKPRAPKPPSEVGGRGTPGEDALVEAARSNRFSDFEAEQWRRVKASRQQA